jgi:hypothetical protein
MSEDGLESGDGSGSENGLDIEVPNTNDIYIVGSRQSDQPSSRE